jgi:hypothetical protein
MSTRKSRVAPIGMAPAMKKSMQICISWSSVGHQSNYCHTVLIPWDIKVVTVCCSDPMGHQSNYCYSVLIPWDIKVVTVIVF